MLFQNILNLHKIINKSISILISILLLFSLLIFFPLNKSQASDVSAFAKYPGYEDLIKELKNKHSKWEFEIVETDLDWDASIKAEHRKNATKKKNEICKCSSCGGKQREPGWYYASEAAIAYYMDPRNFINENYIFQFEKLSFDSSKYSSEELKQIKKSVENIVKPCKYLEGIIKYYDTTGTEKMINKTYVDVIMEAAKLNKVSPYHIAVRIRQEQGCGNAGALISGNWDEKDDNGKTYKGLYNYFNWGAYGETKKDIIINGLKKAEELGWTDPEKAIKGGAEKINDGYISGGQNTLYFQKFNVVTTKPWGYYSHQYMSNIAASSSEGLGVKNAYSSTGCLDEKMVFRIPVFKNMPKELCIEPKGLVTEDVIVNVDSLNVRAEKGMGSRIIARLPKGTKLIRIEEASEKKDGYFWDRVVLSDGSNGFVARRYLTKIELQTNCNEKYFVVGNTNFRNGPGVKGTSVIEYFVPGQIVTVVEKNKYNNLLESEGMSQSWYRVQKADGTYGYTGYSVNEPTIVPYNKLIRENTYDMVKVVCTDGLNVRKESTTKSSVLKSLPKGVILTRIQKNVATKDGYIWDKITTQNGISGYVARKDKDTGEPWILPIEEKAKISGNNLLTLENITVSDLKEKYGNIVVEKNGEKLEADSKLSTNCKIKIEGKTYTVIVLGDTNGDGRIRATDYMKIKNKIMGIPTMTGVEEKAADVDDDGEVRATDYMKIKNHIMETSLIKI